MLIGVSMYVERCFDVVNFNKIITNSKIRIHWYKAPPNLHIISAAVQTRFLQHAEMKHIFQAKFCSGVSSIINRISGYST